MGYTGKMYTLAYYEICERIVSGKLERQWIDDSDIYAYGQGEWVGYDDTESIQVKIQIAKATGLAGMAWRSLDLDDFTGDFCNQGRFPLIVSSWNAWMEHTSSTEIPSTTPVSSKSTSTEHTTSTPLSTTKSTTKSTTTKSTTTTKFNCINGQFYPNPENCSKYYECDNGHLVPFFCNPPLMWDQNALLCNFDYAVDCCNGQRPCPNQ